MITKALKNCRKQFAQKLITGLLALVMVAAVLIPVQSEAATSTNVKVYYNGKSTVTSYKSVNYSYQGKTVNLGSAPIIKINGYVMAPYTMVFVKNGPKAKHSYNSSTGVLILKYNGITLKLKKGSKIAYVNGTKTTMSVAPVFVKYASTKKSYLMVPMNKTCQMLGLSYKYTSSTNKAAVTVSTTSVSSATQATSLKSMTTTQYINTVGPLAQADYKKTGILASVTLAQSILESGWGKSELAQNANNMFGMKTSLSGNTWSGSAWDGTSVYTKKTNEEVNGKTITITASFRKYASIEKSISDHSAYLIGAKNGSSLRYAGLTKATTYKAQIQIIKNGGYATSSSYVTQVCNLITKYNLTKWDK